MADLLQFSRPDRTRRAAVRRRKAGIGLAQPLRRLLSSRQLVRVRGRGATEVVQRAQRFEPQTAVLVVRIGTQRPACEADQILVRVLLAYSSGKAQSRELNGGPLVLGP